MPASAAVPRRLVPDFVASALGRCGFGPTVTLTRDIPAAAGVAVAVRIEDAKDVYNEVECADGVFRTLRPGAVLVAPLGERRALKGYSGHVPATVAVGDTLHVLNLGGMLGCCTGTVPGLGPALRATVLGGVLTDAGAAASVRHGALPPADALPDDAPPLVVVSGTAMDTGKTLAACRLVEGLTARGLGVAAAKLTGAALMRDVRTMRAHGATACATFTDAGVISSVGEDMRPLAKGLIAHLAHGGGAGTVRPDVLVLEMGDGLLGPYGVDALMRDADLQRHTAAHVVAATDLAGAWAAQRLFAERYGAAITAVTGPVTDHEVGRSYLQGELGLAAFNARSQPEALTALVVERLRI